MPAKRERPKYLISSSSDGSVIGSFERQVSKQSQDSLGSLNSNLGELGMYSGNSQDFEEVEERVTTRLSSRIYDPPIPTLQQVGETGGDASIGAKVSKKKIDVPLEFEGGEHPIAGVPFDFGASKLTRDVSGKIIQHAGGASLEISQILGNEIKIAGCIVTDHESNRFVPTNCLFAYNPKDPFHATHIAQEITRIKTKAESKGLHCDRFSVQAVLKCKSVHMIGGLSNGYKSRKFPFEPSDWTKKSKRAKKHVKVEVKIVPTSPKGDKK